MMTVLVSSSGLFRFDANPPAINATINAPIAKKPIGGISVVEADVSPTSATVTDAGSDASPISTPAVSAVGCGSTEGSEATTAGAAAGAGASVAAGATGTAG
ncbi:hypothetical protein EON76_00115 [bacterium]|nr:MAG: hypothetical protein EON76_00115 [bacterium]